MIILSTPIDLFLFIVSFFSSKDEYVTPIIEEVNLDYARTMNSMIFEEVTQADPISFAFVTLPQKTRRLVPPTGCVDIPEYSFNEVFDQFKVCSLFIENEYET